MANATLMNMPMNTSWPKKSRMERLVERFVFDSTRCYTCGSVVYAVEKKKTSNHVYHNRCFRCRICKRALTEAALNEEGDDIYCTNCYRKKQRGDCGGLDFKRAADERAQFVYNRRHPDQPSPKPNPRPPIQPTLSRQTSWNLRQLERKVLSSPGPTTKEFEKPNERYRQSMIDSHPLTINTTASAPNYQTKIRHYLSSVGDEPSPAMKFFPVYSPGLTTNNRTESTSRTPPRTPPRTPTRTPTTPQSHFEFNPVKVQNQKLKLFNNFQPRLNQSSFDLTNTRTPPPDRKRYSINGGDQKPKLFNNYQPRLNQSSFDLTNIRTPPSDRKPYLSNSGNQQYENRDRRRSEAPFFFPDTYITSNPRRSNSINYSVSPRKIL